jgi:molybdopterin-binding protein
MVALNIGSDELKTIIIYSPDVKHYIFQGNEIQVFFKESEVGISLTKNEDISIQNWLPATIYNIESEAILSRVVMKYNNEQIIALISTESVKKLKLHKGMNVFAFVKLNEIVLSQ